MKMLLCMVVEADAAAAHRERGISMRCDTRRKVAGGFCVCAAVAKRIRHLLNINHAASVMNFRNLACLRCASGRDRASLALSQQPRTH